jgi:hypothetical protein
MRGADHVEPFLRRQLVGADLGADVVREDFGRRAGQRAEAGFLEADQEIANAELQGLRARRYLERREGVDMHVRLRALYRGQDAGIGVAGIAWVDAALQADFGGACRRRFGRAFCDLLGGKKIGFVPRPPLGRRLISQC